MSRGAHSRSRVGRRAVSAVATVGALVAAAVSMSSAPLGVGAATCSDVQVVFARGSSEPQGLGSVGRPFVSALASALPGRTVTSYAVVYAANLAQTSAAPGSADLAAHVTRLAGECPDTRFVLGGYSQGATVVDLALGIRTGTGTGTAIPAALSGRVAAIVVFGNPLGLRGQTIASASPTYGPRSRDYCTSGDPVCGSGSNFGAHLTYASGGSTEAGAQFAADLLKGTVPPPLATTAPPAPLPPPVSLPAPTPAPVTPTVSATQSVPTTQPVPTTQSVPTTQPVPTAPATQSPPPVTVCVSATNRQHVAEGRADRFFAWAFARGSKDSLGFNSSFVTTSLQQTGADTWVLVPGC